MTKPFGVLLAGCLVLVAATAAQAVIIRGGDGAGNITAPSDNPGWANVGVVNGASCVYLGNGWVITAEHVWSTGQTSASFGGTSYNILANSWHRLTDPGNSSQAADLGLFRLSSPPTLSSLAISASVPANTDPVLGIGFGRNRGAETWWNSAWLASTAPEAHRGFLWQSSHTMRWGENNIAASGFQVNDGHGLTYALETIFDDPTNGGGNNEMQAAYGDSGGGVFYKRGTQWELTGIFLAVDEFTGQPTTPDHYAVYGNSTYMADLSQYRSQIAAIVPEPGTMLLLAVGGTIWLLWLRRPFARGR